ncbi:MAG: hypothetical protein JRE61_10220 [Deltaproteobacteria bacterium]|jgi:hypothetical protein|nr:hypothetical protein [Deltaproteobacteria bacterium]
MSGKGKGLQLGTLLLMVFATILYGCATTANYEKILSSWVGIHVDNLVSSWGPPQKSFKLSDGGTVLEYIRSGTIPIGGYQYTVPQTTYSSGNAHVYGSSGNYAYGSYSGTSTTYVTQRTPIYNVPLSCVTRFIVDSNNIVRSWRWQGNHCKALPPKSDNNNTVKTNKVNHSAPIHTSAAKPKVYTPVIDENKSVKFQHLKSFLFSYCQTYESKDLDKFAALFTPDALENNRPFNLLLPKYRRNMEMIESFNYRIDLLEYSTRTSTGNILVKGKYFTRFLYEETLRENSGNISMELVENGDSYLVKQLNYNSQAGKKANKQSQWGPWKEIGDKE